MIWFGIHALESIKKLVSLEICDGGVDVKNEVWQKNMSEVSA